MTPRILANAVLYAVITVYFGAFTGLKCTFPMIRPFWFDASLSSWSRTLHHGIPWFGLHVLFGHSWSNGFVAFIYYGIWPIILVVSPLFAASLKDRALRQRYLLCYVLAWMLLGTIAALIFMSAGPIFYDHVTGDMRRYQDMETYLQGHRMAWGASHLWSIYQRGAIEPGGGISDFPSMHVALSTLATCLGWSLNRWIGVAMTAFTFLIVLSSVYLGWHYAIGDYVVIPTVCALWQVTAPGQAAALAARFARKHPSLAMAFTAEAQAGASTGL